MKNALILSKLMESIASANTRISGAAICAMHNIKMNCWLVDDAGAITGALKFIDCCCGALACSPNSNSGAFAGALAACGVPQFVQKRIDEPTLVPQFVQKAISVTRSCC
jgi:hypothetical protein